MREIEFRGKRIDNGEWVYGYLVMDTDTKRAYIVTKSYWGCEDCSDQTLYYEVIPETVGQYTGLKDKNGVKIYEGDVVKLSYANYNSVVKFENGGFEPFVIKGWECEFEPNSYIVINNIHDNPELVGGAE